MQSKSQLELIILSIKDLLSSSMLKVALIPFLITLSIVYFAFFSIANTGLDALENTTAQVQTYQSSMQDGIATTQTTNETITGYWILDFLLKYSITSWIVTFLVYTVGSFVVLWVSLFISLIIIGFLTPKILSYIQHKYYPNIKLEGEATTLESILYLLKSIFIMLLLFILLIPFYLIPIVNIVAINLPFYYFFHKMLHYDVGSTLLTKQNHTTLKNNNTFTLRFYSLFLYFISMIPFVALILPVFYILYLGHNYMNKISQDIKIIN